eukprot:365885-Chlamydomonas_euryale.AAC.15
MVTALGGVDGDGIGGTNRRQGGGGQRRHWGTTRKHWGDQKKATPPSGRKQAAADWGGDSRPLLIGEETAGRRCQGGGGSGRLSMAGRGGGHRTPSDGWATDAS